MTNAQGPPDGTDGRLPSGDLRVPPLKASSRARVTKPTASALLASAVLLVIVLSPAGSDELVLATTTSTYDSGLLDHILPDFESRHGVEVKVIAAGTGQALRLGRAGDADVLLVHAPEEELAFVESGHGLYRRAVMYNEFIIVGPPDDPAEVDGQGSATDALRLISERQATFCSRGDDSGTHARERALWAEAGLSYSRIASRESSDWYMSLGQGMGDTLRMASDLGGYALTDEGTFYALEGELDLDVHVSQAEGLRNQYSVVPVDGSRHNGVGQELAEAFASWMVSQRVQAMIDGYTREGRVLFHANAGEGSDGQ
jgi:tungstate transport system substrate-binding protein